MELTKIYSVGGLLAERDGLIKRRASRGTTPHSDAAGISRGRRHPKARRDIVSAQRCAVFGRAAGICKKYIGDIKTADGGKTGTPGAAAGSL